VETAYATLWLGALKHGASDSRTAAAVGARFLRDGQAEDAEIWFDKAIRDDAKDLETLLIIGCAYQRAGMHQKAESHFQRVLKIGKKGDDDGPLVQMAWMFADFGLLERSNQAIAAAVEADPRDCDNLMEWAAILYRNHQAEPALAAMQEALSHGKGTERLLIKACQILSGDFRSFYTIRPVGFFPPIQAKPWQAPVLGEALQGHAIQLAERLFAGNPSAQKAAQAGAAMAALGMWERASSFSKAQRRLGKMNLRPCPSSPGPIFAMGYRKRRPVISIGLLGECVANPGIRV
jgi:tetratricopeptide (TPR) repeat protein